MGGFSWNPNVAQGVANLVGNTSTPSTTATPSVSREARAEVAYEQLALACTEGGGAPADIEAVFHDIAAPWARSALATDLATALADTPALAREPGLEGALNGLKQWFFADSPAPDMKSINWLADTLVEHAQQAAGGVPPGETTPALYTDPEARYWATQGQFATADAIQHANDNLQASPLRYVIDKIAGMHDLNPSLVARYAQMLSQPDVETSQQALQQLAIRGFTTAADLANILADPLLGDYVSEQDPQVIAIYAKPSDQDAVLRQNPDGSASYTGKLGTATVSAPTTPAPPDPNSNKVVYHFVVRGIPITVTYPIGCNPNGGQDSNMPTVDTLAKTFLVETDEALKALSYRTVEVQGVSGPSWMSTDVDVVNIFDAACNSPSDFPSFAGALSHETGHIIQGNDLGHPGPGGLFTGTDITAWKQAIEKDGLAFTGYGRQAYQTTSGVNTMEDFAESWATFLRVQKLGNPSIAAEYQAFSPARWAVLEEIYARQQAAKPDGS